MSAAPAWHWPVWLVVAGGVLLGISVPYSSMIRTRWTHVLRQAPGHLNSPLSLTSVLEEMMRVIGNPTATVLATSITRPPRSSGAARSKAAETSGVYHGRKPTHTT